MNKYIIILLTCTSVGLLSGCAGLGNVAACMGAAYTETTNDINSRYGSGTIERASQNKIQCVICRGNGICRECDGEGCYRCKAVGTPGRCWSCKGTGVQTAVE